MKQARAIAGLVVAGVLFAACGGGGGGANRSAAVNNLTKAGLPKDQAECIVDALEKTIGLDKLSKMNSQSDLSQDDMAKYVDAAATCVMSGISVPGT